MTVGEPSHNDRLNAETNGASGKWRDEFGRIFDLFVVQLAEFIPNFWRLLSGSGFLMVNRR